MKRGSLSVALIVLLMAACTSQAHKASQTPTPTPTSTATATVTGSATPSSSPHPRPTNGSLKQVPKTPSSSGGSRQAFYPSISNDGRLVAFASYRRHPGQCYYQGDADPAGNQDTCVDIYRYNFATNQTVLVSRTHDASAANGQSWDPTIS